MLFRGKFSGCLCCKPFCAFAKSLAHQCQFATTCKLQQLPVCNKPSIKFCVDTYFSFFKEFQLCLQSFHNHRMTLPFPSFSKYLHHSEVMKEFSTAWRRALTLNNLPHLQIQSICHSFGGSHKRCSANKSISQLQQKVFLSPCKDDFYEFFWAHGDQI